MRELLKIKMDINEKKTIRREMTVRRDSLTPEERAEFSGRIAEKLFQMDMYCEAETVLSYASFRSEVITDEINRRVIADGKELYLPKVYMDRQEMLFYRARNYDTDLSSGAMGIREPDTSIQFVAVPDRFDQILVIVPGVAFDTGGNRMGYGGGFYDRFLSVNQGLADRTLFIAYEIQRLDELSVEPTDIRIKHILTEADFYDTM